MNYGLQEVFMNKVLTDYFCGGYPLYVGLGLSNQGASENIDMFVEPNEEGNGYNKVLLGTCTLPNDGVTYNASSIIFPTAEKDWTVDSQVIDKLGIFTATENVAADGTRTTNYTLWCVLPLVPAEKVLAGDTVVINANAIRLQLTNR
jgi:hypothetical protein